MKPVQSGFKKAADDSSLVGDALLLARAADLNSDFQHINPYCLEESLTPRIAAELAGVKIDTDLIMESFNELKKKHQFMVVEGAGGILAPLTDRLLMADLIVMMGMPIIIVARANLGTINHTLLTISYARSRGLNIAGVVISSSLPERGIAEKTNPDLISELGGVPLLGIIPYLDKLEQEDIIQAVDDSLNWEVIDTYLQKGKPEQDLDLVEKDRKYVWYPFTQMKDWVSGNQIIIERGEGISLIGIDGRRYYDGVSSLWLNVHGHRRAEIDRAVSAQLGKISHSTMLGLSHRGAIELAEQLIESAPAGLKRVFYSDNGSTSVEVALKMAFQYWQHKGVKNKNKFLTLTNAYHGDTIGSVSVGGIDIFHQIFHPLLFKALKAPSPYCYRCVFQKEPAGCGFACVDATEELMSRNHEELAAMIIEPKVQGAGGIIVQPPGYLSRIKELCNKYNLLLITDEVATGFGKTGKMFACEHENISPDFLTVSKGITGGYLPLAATMVTGEIYDAFLAEHRERKTFFHGHSYTGNPLACAAALANLEIFTRDKVMEKMQPKIVYLSGKLNDFAKLEHVGEIRQSGFMVGIELVRDKKTKESFPVEERRGVKACLAARKKGLIIRPLDDVVVFMPPLATEPEELDEMIEILYQSIGSVGDDN
ncbi:MAG: Adenosylmethionine-8-amino-7-oxononanoate aminotransferase [Desulfotomaculum sp. 46_80]|nr:MAG: Adenosylmethionine-8-amino-7-oxononanoate aminotransferase [Desulfotomaculum sp. 46_80]